MKNGKSRLYLIFECLDTNLKKFLKGFDGGSLPPKIVKVFVSPILFVLSFSILHCIDSFRKAGL